MEGLSVGEKKTLLKIARDTISYKLGLSPDFNFSRYELTDNLKKGRGAFVTLHKHGRLRGCIGNFGDERPLYETVHNMAIEAAFRDPRFFPLKKEEFNDIDIEISALTPLTPIKDINEIQVGVHGIYIIKGINRGVLLPQVAVEHGWDRLQFLDQTCIKAGLRPGCWKDEDCMILIFSAEVFGEKDFTT